MPRSGIAELYGNSTFNHLSNYRAVFQSYYTILHSLQPCMSVSISLHPHQHLLIADFFILASLVSMRWFLIVGLI